MSQRLGLLGRELEALANCLETIGGLDDPDLEEAPETDAYHQALEAG